MNLKLIIDYSDLTNDDVDSFWKQGVCMDDWDYIILAPVGELYEDEELDWQNKKVKVWRAEPTLSRLLTGCCDNTWYKAEFRGKMYAVGVSYHS